MTDLAKCAARPVTVVVMAALEKENSLLTYEVAVVGRR